MKKVIYSLLAFVVIFTLAACSGEEEKTGDDKEEDRTIPVEVQEVTKKRFDSKKILSMVEHSRNQVHQSC